ncbi:MarR family transcriptional regulator [Agromyces protaetiae]|uniref:MarR family transcriptional regulator n=1 Tax=Agromyces protaetiae TaxID=2509455 RepID=A0A4P6FDV8_9MICO|nr:MarR family transcriptional regulator [Agromyces protaetiae]QAY72559.1 MarR family transcriptional regulator [Agromyces protaetiae]
MERAEASEASDPVQLDDMVCWNLYSAARAVTAAYRPLLEPLGLTYPQYLVLANLWAHGDQSVGALIARIQSDYGTMTPLLKRLEARGLVRRTRSVADERTVLISLTAEGEALKARAAHVYPAISELFGFSGEGAERSLDVLRGIIRAAERAGGEGPGEHVA